MGKKPSLITSLAAPRKKRVWLGQLFDINLTYKWEMAQFNIYREAKGHGQ